MNRALIEAACAELAALSSTAIRLGADLRAFLSDAPVVVDLVQAEADPASAAGPAVRKSGPRPRATRPAAPSTPKDQNRQPPPADPAPAAQVRGRRRQTAERATKDERTVALVAEHHGLKAAEIAAHLGEPVERTWWRLKRLVGEGKLVTGEDKKYRRPVVVGAPAVN